MAVGGLLELLGDVVVVVDRDVGAQVTAGLQALSNGRAPEAWPLMGTLAVVIAVALIGTLAAGARGIGAAGRQRGVAR